jgi:hypothetical protein
MIMLSRLLALFTRYAVETATEFGFEMWQAAYNCRMKATKSFFSC